MKLAIKLDKLPKEPGYIAQIDWSKGDAGKVGTPGAVKYGESLLTAYFKMRCFLLDKGHEIIY